VDKEIAKRCKDVDIVIGGHSHTFLYDGVQMDVDVSEGPYPTVITRSNGQAVPVVQAAAYTKYMGKLHVRVVSFRISFNEKYIFFVLFLLNSLIKMVNL